MHMVENMIEQGDFKREEFLKPERYGMKLLLKNLFLLACSEKMKNAVDSGSALSLHISPRQSSSTSAPEVDKENPARPREMVPR